MAGYKKNLKEVEEHLQENEEIKYSIYGAYATEIMGNDSLRNGIFVATSSRIVFFAKKMFGYDLETFPFKTISSIDISFSKLKGHEIKFFASGNTISMKYVNKGDVQEFKEYVSSMIGKKQSDNSTVDIPEQIKKLAELKDQGILTDEEFSEKKKQLLEKM